MRCTTGAAFAHLDPSQLQGRGFAKGVTGSMAYDTMLAVVIKPIMNLNTYRF